MAYEYLAGCYDRFTADVPYAAWADYLEKHFARSKLPIHTVLDLACGTGSLTCELAERGYEMIGADLSEEMLAQAAEKARNVSGIPPIFLHQAMEELARRCGQEAEEALERLRGRFEYGLVLVLCAAIGLVLLSVMLPLLGVLSAIGG